MYYGAPYTCDYGDSEDFAQDISIVDLITGPQVSFIPLSGYGQWFRFVVDGFNQGAPFFASEGVPSSTRGQWSSPDPNNHAISVVGQGQWSLDVFDAVYQQILWQEGRSKSFTLQIPANPQIFSMGDTGQLSNWVLDGVVRFTNCSAVINRPQWASLTSQITTVAGVHTVSLMANGTIVASGTLTGNGTVTLVDQGSGVEGTVLLNFTGDFAGGTVYLRWPAAYNIYFRSSGPYVPSDFPMTPQGSVGDDGRSNTFPFQSGTIAPATYYYVTHAISDTGIEDQNANNTTIVIDNVPNAPGTPFYLSGGAAATVIGFQASTSVGATYHLYDSKTVGALNMGVVSQNLIAGVGPQTATLAAISPTFAGVRQIIIRAVNGSVEEGNVDILSLSYDGAGNVIPLLPNAPGTSPSISVNGLELTVPWSYSTLDQAIQADTILLYAWGVHDSLDLNCPIGRAKVGNIQLRFATGFISGSVCYDGLYYYGLRASANGNLSNNVDFFGPVLLTTQAQPSGSASGTGGL